MIYVGIVICILICIVIRQNVTIQKNQIAQTRLLVETLKECAKYIKER